MLGQLTMVLSISLPAIWNLLFRGRLVWTVLHAVAHLSVHLFLRSMDQLAL